MEQIELYIGERRTVSIEFFSCGDESFVIRNPKYRLKRNNEVEAEGELFTENHVLQVVIEPKTIGHYVLEFQVEIANEIVIRRISVYVRK